MKSDAPNIINVTKKAIQQFQNLKKEKDSLLFNRSAKEVFIMSMTMGFYNDNKIALESKKEFVRIEYLNDKEKSLIKAIAVFDEGNIDVLLDKKKVYSIAEEYAAGGIQHLVDDMLKELEGSAIKKLETQLVEEFTKLKK